MMSLFETNIFHILCWWVLCSSLSSTFCTWRASLTSCRANCLSTKFLLYFLSTVNQNTTQDRLWKKFTKSYKINSVCSFQNKKSRHKTDMLTPFAKQILSDFFEKGYHTFVFLKSVCKCGVFVHQPLATDCKKRYKIIYIWSEDENTMYFMMFGSIYKTFISTKLTMFVWIMSITERKHVCHL